MADSSSMYAGGKFDPYDRDQYSRLCKSIDAAEQSLEKYRKNRKVILDALHDPCHDDKNVPTDKRLPSNPLAEMFDILTRGVVDQNPTLRIPNTTRAAGMLKARLERWAATHNLSVALQGIFHEVLLRWGIGYMGFEIGDNGVEPYLDVLDFDDYFIDQAGSDENDIDFEGHSLCRRHDELIGNQDYDQEEVKKLKTYTTRPGNSAQSRTLYDRVDMKRVWLPREGLIITLASKHHGAERPLQVKRYIGPSWGPYLRMDLGKVRSCMVPVSRASMLYDLAEFVVRTYRHVFVQADRELEAYAYPGEAEKDAEKHRRLQQDEYVKMDNPDAIKKIKKGGVNNSTLATAIHASQLFSERAGNLKLLGGLGPSAPTARQEAGLGLGVQQAVDFARTRMAKLTKRIFDTVAFYYTMDDGHEEMVDWTTPNGNKVKTEWKPQVAAMLRKDFPALDIIPGSMVSRSAEQQLGALVDGVRTIGAMMVLPGAKPTVFDLEYFKELVAEYGNMPEIERLYSSAPDANAVVPGDKNAALVNQPRGGSTGGVTPDPTSKMAERLIFSGQPQGGEE